MDSHGNLPDILWLRRYLSEYQMYVGDPELRAEIKDWVEESREKTSAASAREHVRSQLMDETSGYPMYHDPTVQDPSDAFPDSCRDCRHYGSACPIFHDETVVRERERKLSEADSEEESRGVWEEQSEQTGCVLIPEMIEEWTDEHQDFVSKGYSLYVRINDRIDDSGDEGSPDYVDDSDDPLMGIGDSGL